MNHKITIGLLIILTILISGCTDEQVAMFREKYEPEIRAEVQDIVDESISAHAVNPVVCDAPYIRYGTGCCLDKNNNKICDNDESEPEEPEPYIPEPEGDYEVEVYMFYGEGCPHCAKEELFLSELEEKYSQLEVERFEIYFNDKNNKLFQEMGRAYGIEARGVPTLFVGKEAVVGFNDDIGEKIELEIKKCIANGCIDPSDMLVEIIEEEEVEEVEEEVEFEQRDVPVVDLFVMSHCPYALQMERGIIPVLELLGDEIDFNLRFVSYVMHGEEEMYTQLIQYCIQRDHEDELLDYLECFMEEGDFNGCLVEVGISEEDLDDECMDEVDDEFGIQESFDDQDSWLSGRYPRFNIDKELNEKYGVSGSPTLVVNGVKVNSARDPASLLKTICAGFTDKPSECSEELSAGNPSAGFSG
ncbi:hypothetical protein KY343_00950 [Candidatus Woesearchaeota archaeon]|nr:hypothetical protein [Candidatus Woesearchaeota archaeon]